MVQRILLLALMSTQNLHDTRSEYLLIKLDSQSDDIESRTPETVPLATEAPEIVTISAQKASPKFEKKTFQKLNKNETNPGKKGTARMMPRSCENYRSDWWCRDNYGRCDYVNEVRENCRRTCDDPYYCDCPSFDFTCNSYNSFNEEGPGNRKCINRNWLNDGDCDCNNCEDEQGNGNCRRGEWRCDNGDCIQSRFKCDRQRDCLDGSDEKNCPAERCLTWQWECNNGQCIHDSYKCDREYDCSDNSDESDAVCLGTYEIERSRACREESRVSGFSLYDAKLACSATAWCEMFYQKDDGFYFCSYGETYYDRYATLYRKPRFGFRDNSESTRSQDIADKPPPPPKNGTKSAPPLKIQLKKFVTKKFSPMG